MHDKPSDKYLYNRDGVYQFIRRIPNDLSDHYGSSRVQISLGTQSPSRANRCARSITQRLDDYWLGLLECKINQLYFCYTLEIY